MTALLKKEGKDFLVLMAEARQLWSQIAQADILRLAEIDSLHDGVLFFRVKSPTVGSYLRRDSRRILKAFKSAGLPVTRISWFVG